MKGKSRRKGRKACEKGRREGGGKREGRGREEGESEGGEVRWREE